MVEREVTNSRPVTGFIALRLWRTTPAVFLLARSMLRWWWDWKEWGVMGRVEWAGRGAGRIAIGSLAKVSQIGGTMRSDHSIALLAALFWGGVDAQEAARSDTPRPNLLVIVSDNQPAWAMGCAGNETIKTPHLDQLARQGVRFRNAFVTTPICAASRASLFTGLYRRNHGFTFNVAPLRAELAAASYPALLRKEGYHTGLIGKFGIESNGQILLEDAEHSQKLMFDHFDNFEHWGRSGPRGYFVTRKDGTKQHLTDVTAEKAVAYLQKQKKGEPFCLSLSFNAPHAQDDDPKQYFWPVRFDPLYEGATIPAPRNSEPAFFRAQPEFIRNSLGRERWRWRFDTPGKYQAMMKGMFRMVSGVDDAVGRVRRELKALGLSKNTVIVFTSDNGMLFGERGLSDCWLLYEESIRVPLIVFDPRRNESGLVRDEMVLNLDLAPTLLDLGGVERRPTMDGRSLVPLLSRESTLSWRKDFLCEHLFNHGRIPKSEGVRTERWKYIRYFEQRPVYEELYDLKADPHERVNLVANENYVAELNQLRKRCDEMIRASRGE